MAVAQSGNPAVKSHETTPLLPRESAEPVKYGRSVVYRALLAGFMISASFGVTQVPYVHSSSEGSPSAHRLQAYLRLPPDDM